MNTPTPQFTGTVTTFTELLASTRRGARRARLLVAERLQDCPVPHDVAERAELIVAELAGNAVLHGHVPGRCFRVTLTLTQHGPHAAPETTGTLRIAVTDARGEKPPVLRTASDHGGEPDPGDDTESDGESESGRGLLIVAALADRWGTEPYPPSGKSVWAECDTPG